MRHGSALAAWIKKRGYGWLQVIGMHFMNPPPLMTLVEVVRGMATADEVFDTIKALAERYCSKQRLVMSIESLP